MKKPRAKAELNRPTIWWSKKRPSLVTSCEDLRHAELFSLLWGINSVQAERTKNKNVWSISSMSKMSCLQCCLFGALFITSSSPALSEAGDSGDLHEEKKVAGCSSVMEPRDLHVNLGSLSAGLKHSACPFLLCKLEITIVTMSQGCYKD